MDRYIFFSKSNWDEPPRLRHQLVNLIRSYGGDVVFFQKPVYVWGKRLQKTPVRVDADLWLARTRQLIHHQLRVLSVLRWMNALIEKRSIRNSLKKLPERPSIVINFNYDYYFLREIFPTEIIVTIINDDFVAQAKLFGGKHVRESLRITSAVSDLVLVVSYPLEQQVSEWCAPKLFLPWSDVSYRHPAPQTDRDAVLLWAYIDARIDFNLLRECAAKRPEVTFYVVGPQSSVAVNMVIQLASCAGNIVVLPEKKLEDLPLDRFFAGIIPYKNNIGDIAAVTMSNKSLQLMARGLPLVTHGMPSFYEHSAIIKAEGIDDFLIGLDYCRNEFFDIQAQIEKLIEQNMAEHRFSYLKKLVCDAKQSQYSKSLTTTP
jgi:hypothetical protein